MMLSSRRERRLLILSSILGLLALLQLGVVRPVLRSVRRLGTKLRVSALSLQQMNEAIARRSQVESGYAAIRNRITSVKKPEQEIMEILLSVQKIAQEAGVEIMENVHLKDDPSEYFSVHTVHFVGRGEIKNMIRMLHALQDPQRLLKIPQMQLAIKDFKLEMSLNITRVVYQAGQNG